MEGALYKWTNYLAGRRRGRGRGRAGAGAGGGSGRPGLRRGGACVRGAGLRAAGAGGGCGLRADSRVGGSAGRPAGGRCPVRLVAAVASFPSILCLRRAARPVSPRAAEASGRARSLNIGC